MTTLLERPAFTHLLSTGGPPDLPPEMIQTGSRDDGPPDEDHCPACANVKAATCRCGYDWDNWRWVDRQ
jgi:hypothetical protein